MVAAEGGNNILQIFTIFGESTYLHFLLVESIYLCVYRKDYTLYTRAAVQICRRESLW